MNWKLIKRYSIDREQRNEGGIEETVDTDDEECGGKIGIRVTPKRMH